jgi:hypothetical protein
MTSPITQTRRLPGRLVALLLFCADDRPASAIVAAALQHLNPVSVRVQEKARQRRAGVAVQRANFARALPELRQTLPFALQILALGQGCMVVAPSMIPRKSGERVKTNRRDAQTLACMHRAGELSAVWVPDDTHEAVRDLVRTRAAAVEDYRRKRQQVGSFLLRLACRPPSDLEGTASTLAAFAELRSSRSAIGVSGDVECDACGSRAHRQAGRHAGGAYPDLDNGTRRRCLPSGAWCGIHRGRDGSCRSR